MQCSYRAAHIPCFSTGFVQLDHRNRHKLRELSDHRHNKLKGQCQYLNNHIYFLFECIGPNCNWLLSARTAIWWSPVVLTRNLMGIRRITCESLLSKIQKYAFIDLHYVVFTKKCHIETADNITLWITVYYQFFEIICYTEIELSLHNTIYLR